MHARWILSYERTLYFKKKFISDLIYTTLNNSSVDGSCWAVHRADNELSLMTPSNSN